jgi:hypothetical protein
MLTELQNAANKILNENIRINWYLSKKDWCHYLGRILTKTTLLSLIHMWIQGEIQCYN